MAAASFTLKEIAEKLDLEYSGNSDLCITHVCGIDKLQSGGLAFLNSPGGLTSVPTPAGMARNAATNVDQMESTQVAVIVSPEMKNEEHNLLLSSDPLATHVAVARMLHPVPLEIPGLSENNQIHPTAVLGKNVELGENVLIAPNVVLYDGVKIGDRTVLHAGVVVMSDTSIGSDCMIFPNAVIQYQCEIGDRVIVQSGAVIGADGHGYFQRKGVNHKIPQVGNVKIEDDVEIGACTTIDRARFRTTTVGQGSKVDNQVQIAHNVVIGEQALISAQTAVGGSVQAGHHLILGGQSGIKDNVLVGNHVTAVARSVITATTQDNEVVAGMPGRQLDRWRYTQSLINRLAELFDRVRKLENPK